MWRDWVVRAVAATMLAALTPSAHGLAQEPDGDSVRFSVTPSRLEVRVAPGDTLRFAIQTINHSEEPLTLQTYIDDVDIPRHDLIDPDELAFTASRWMRPETDQVVVPPGGTLEVVITADIPEGTPAGGYHALAYFQATRPASPENGIVARGRIGATLLLEVRPDGSDLRREARVSRTDLSVSWDGLLRPTVDADVTLDNTGDLHLVAGAVHTYRSWPDRGSTTEKVDALTVLRGTRRSLTSSTSAVPLLGKVTLTSEVVYQVSPDDLPVIVTQASIWVIPWHLIAAAVVLGAAAWLVRRRWRTASDAPPDDTDADDPVDGPPSATPTDEEVPVP